MGILLDATQEWIDTLELAPHQRPIATLALQLASGLDGKRTAASAKEFRATCEALAEATGATAGPTPQVEANAAAILGLTTAPAASPARTSPPPKLTPARRRVLEKIGAGEILEQRDRRAGGWLHQQLLVDVAADGRYRLTPAGAAALGLEAAA